MELENKVSNGTQNPSNENTSIEPVLETVIKDGEDSLDAVPKKKRVNYLKCFLFLFNFKDIYSQGRIYIWVFWAAVQGPVDIKGPQLPIEDNGQYCELTKNNLKF